MPFLRFARDKRGYETTSLVHAVRHGGRSRQRILYWFRTPPGVKVGRPALDEEAIRWIEEHNPDIEFNWAKILEAEPPADTSVDEARGRRGRRDKPERRRKAKTSGAPTEMEAAASALPPVTGGRDETLASEVEPPDVDVAEIEEETAIEATSEEEVLAEAIEQLTHPEAEEKVEPPSMPAEQTIGGEELTRLRARFAELQARITERGGDLERVDALRAQAEALNPDSWVTDEEVRRGVEEFEPRIRDLRAALGLRRRRRSRRGGRRRRSPNAPSATGATGATVAPGAAGTEGAPEGASGDASGAPPAPPAETPPESSE